jgi:hypothetical protein
MANLSRPRRGPRAPKPAPHRQLCNSPARSKKAVLANEATKQRKQQTRQLAILAIVVILVLYPNVPPWLFLVIAALGGGAAAIEHQRVPSTRSTR